MVSEERDDVVLLCHGDAVVAARIWRVMQAAYRVEAALLGVEDFAPLARTAEQVAGAASTFVGVRRGDDVVALAEIEAGAGGAANIASLVVLPPEFRRGHATRLLRYIIASHGGRDLTVSTGSDNAPALRLYERNSFRVQRRWATECGIEMVTLMRPAARK